MWYDVLPYLSIALILITVLYALLRLMGCIKAQPILLALCLVGALIVYSKGGQLKLIHHQGEERRAIVHTHELAHYYLGARYFDQLGYDGLYDALLAADLETPPISITHREIRDLEGRQLKTINRFDALERFNTQSRPHFSDEEWTQFVSDVDALKKMTPSRHYFNDVVYDNGFNPTPVWLLYGAMWSHMFDVTPPEWLVLPDIVLQLLLFFFIWRTIGWEGAGLCAIFYGCSQLPDMNWVQGSLWRFLWLFATGAGILALMKERYLWAGGLLALAMLDRLFPVYAVIAVLGCLGWRGLVQHQWAELKHFLIGMIAVIFVHIAVASAVYGSTIWLEYITVLRQHEAHIFVNSVGYARAMVFEPWTRIHHFAYAEGLPRFAEWNRLFDSYMITNQHWHQLLKGLIIAAFLAVLPHMKPASFALLGLSIGLFLWHTPTHYYFVFLFLWPAIWWYEFRECSNQSQYKKYGVIVPFSTFGLVWAAAPWVVGKTSFIDHFHYLSLGLLWLIIIIMACYIWRYYGEVMHRWIKSF